MCSTARSQKNISTLFISIFYKKNMARYILTVLLATLLLLAGDSFFQQSTFASLNQQAKSSSTSSQKSETPANSRLLSSGAVISQVYGGGGNSGATLRNDFIEIFNRGNASINLTGMSVQYASAAGTTWQVTNLLSGSLAPGQYYLIKKLQEQAGPQTFRLQMLRVQSTCRRRQERSRSCPLLLR